MLNMDKEKEIKKSFAAAAAEQIDEAAVQVGLTAEGAELIKQKILGIT